jgi:hypothetical protein
MPRKVGSVEEELAAEAAPPLPSEPKAEAAEDEAVISEG